MIVNGHGVKNMTITYSWKCEIDKIQSYNINSSQANIVHHVSWTFSGDNGTRKVIVGGTTAFDITEGVESSFISIENVTKDTLENWIKSTLGNNRIAEMKEEIKTTLENIDTSIDIAPQE